MKVLRVLTLVIFALLNFSFCLAQSMWYRTTEFAYNYKEYGNWTGWSDWIDSNVKVEIDLGNDVITIFSQDLQKYYVLGQVDAPYDSTGEQIRFKVIDQDRDYGFVRLRVENSGNIQIYVDFDNIRWVYNVVRIQ